MTMYHGHAKKKIYQGVFPLFSVKIPSVTEVDPTFRELKDLFRASTENGYLRTVTEVDPIFRELKDERVLSILEKPVHSHRSRSHISGIESYLGPIGAVLFLFASQK